ncbi:hypothetical protein [Nocardia sp. NPDC050406]|uniref:hypothetical protein n=1 Tax=Nocardia sp. NPDC050406 TaxID=3364318 RepID=UPI00378FDC80
MMIFASRKSLVRSGILTATIGVALTVPQTSAAAAPIRYGAIAWSDSYAVGTTVVDAASPEDAQNQAVAGCSEQAPLIHVPATGSSGAQSGYSKGGDCSWRAWISSGHCASLVSSSTYDPKDGTVGITQYTTGVGATRYEADFNAINAGPGYKPQIITSICQD